MTKRHVYFTSDAHLGSGFHADPRAVEARLVRWLESIRPTARAVYFLGDMFDYWFEYHDVVPRGYVRFLGKVAELADEGTEIHFFAGNHDVWFSDYIQTEVGAVIHHTACCVELDGRIFRLAHGDEEDRSKGIMHRLLYALFRNRIARKLYAAIHPRWTVGFALAWSLHSRRRGLRQATEGVVPHAYANAYFDVEQEHLVRCTKAYIAADDRVDYYLYGHRHMMLDLMLSKDKRMLILGDWLQYQSYAVWDGNELILEQFEHD